jgi:predicted Rossmann fold flavoprotein
MDVGIIGGGAAGFFAAISVKENYPSARVTILEKSKKVLAKVKISGGGRCNVTNGCKNISDLIKAYPRSGRSLKKAFHAFSNKDAMEWFENKGVELVTQSDGCVFPQSQSSQTIIDCITSQAKRLGVVIITGKSVNSITLKNEKLAIGISNSDELYPFNKVIVTTGGSPKRAGLQWLELLGHKIADPVPSLFSFNIPNQHITQLMGIVVDNVILGIQGTKIKSEGTLLITHWGMSGPAILKLSSYAARTVSEMNYNFNLQVNWVNQPNNELVSTELFEQSKSNPKKQLANARPYNLPERLWEYLLAKADLPLNKKWEELGKKAINKLVEILTNDIYQVKGKATHKEEFVTCGGVSLESIDLNTMQSKVYKNLYFAGEVLDVDAVTGGYNLQAAWTTGYIAGQLK